MLLWSRDPIERTRRGHVDLPRLIEGNVALETFSVVTKVPATLNYRFNPGRLDVILPLAIAQRWPSDTWTSLQARAMYLAQKLADAAARSEGRLLEILSVADVEQLIARRRRGEEVVGALLLLEGLHGLDGRLEAIDELYRRGYRIMAPTHLFDNRVGGSAHGIHKGGLTEFGRRALAKMEETGIIVDLAHASPRLLDDVLEFATRPVIVSHTGVKGTCGGSRNLSDRHIRAIADAGGLIGVGFWRGAVCRGDVTAIVEAIRYVADLVGVNHVALGSDFDGAVSVPFDASGMLYLTSALIREGFTEDEIRKVMGENVLELLRETLPPY